MQDILDFERPIYELENKIQELKNASSNTFQLEALEEQLVNLKRQIFSNLTSWQKTLLARHPKRPVFSDYIQRIFKEFIELSGDRLNKDDRAIIGGLAWIENYKVVIVGHNKGKDLRTNIESNFGMPHPQGYRKAQRLAKLAEKFQKPLILFVDTPGAYPGKDAEEHGQAISIAQNIYTLMNLKTHILVVVIGEGGSGGALAVGIGDIILMFEYAIYSVISPEGCAAILWKDSKKADEAAEALKLTAEDLLSLKIIDEIIKEPLGGAHKDHEKAAEYLKSAIITNLEELLSYEIQDLVKKRYQRFRNIGQDVIR